MKNKAPQHAQDRREPSEKSILLPVILALGVTVLFWGSSFPVVKIVLRGMSPVAYIFFRFTAASFLFGLLMVKKFRRLPFRVHMKLFLIALFDPTLYFLFETSGLQYTSASSASLIIAGVPGMVALLAGIFLKERLTSRQWAGVLLAICGVILLVGFDDNAAYAESSLLGNVLILLAVVSTAFYMITARHISGQVGVVELTFYQMVYGMLQLLPLFLLFEDPVVLAEIPGESMLAFLFLVFGATIVAFLCYNYAISKIHVSRAAVFINGIPLVSVILSAFLLGEKLGVKQFIGGAVIIAGVTLTNLRRKAPVAEIEIRDADPADPRDLESLRTLFREYVDALGEDLGYQGFEEELRDLPGKYSPPRGSLHLAFVKGVPAGCVALRPLEDGGCEMKRLFVRPQFRGLHLGRGLVEAVLAAARARGYRTMKLDTLQRLEAARRLYRSFGFRESSAYTYNPLPGALFMELNL
jgi:drug/metabolite transporter (DMT)-like permease/GNAT superfamily N-acetyltransferase